jgi:hypothetical protein
MCLVQYMVLVAFGVFPPFTLLFACVISVVLQKFINMQDAIIRNLYDDDLSVVQAALSIEGLAAVASPVGLLKAYDHVLAKCIDIIRKGR